MCGIKKIIRIIACLCWMSSGELDAGMGVIHAVNPQSTRSAWNTALRQATFFDEVTPTILFDSNGYNGVITINTPGLYQLAHDLSSRIVITTSNVSLDLGLYTITRAVGSDTIITISSNLANVTVTNGYLKNIDTVATGGSGIYVGSGCTNIVVHDVSVIGCTMGIMLAGVNGSLVNGCTLSRLNFIANMIGVSSTYAQSIVLQECSALYSTQSGFELNNCQSHCLYDCTALKTTGTATAVGFKSTGGTSNLFQRCVAERTKTSSTTFGDKSCGLLLTGSETKTKIVDCVVNETDVVSTQTAITYGVNLAPMFAWGGYVSGFPASNSWTIGSPKWSPDSKYIVTTHKDTGNGYGSNIYTWNGLTFVVVGGSAIGTSGSLVASDVAWSPDGKYYVTATADGATFLGNTGLYAYSFNGTTDTALGSTLPTLNTINLTAVRFSPNGKFIATGGLVSGTNSTYLSIWSFTPSATPALVDLGDKNLGSVGPWQSMSWSPDGQYIATIYSNTVVVYSVSAAGALSSVAVASYTFTNVASVAWSPCGKYIAAGDNTGKVQLLTFDGTSSLKFVAQATGLSASFILGLDWSPDGQYIVAPGADVALTNRVRILQYNGTSTLAVVATSSTNATRMANISWSPDGKYIVTMDYNAVAGGAVNVHMFNAMYGPTNCLIDSCRVADTLASNMNMGRGIVAGGTTIVTRTIACNNGINYSYGIPNVYDGRFEILRAVVQPFDNISMPTTL